MKKVWDEYYKNMPLDDIPWQHTQADWFKELVDNKKIGGKTALELGCGTGKKCIYLAGHGFEKVVGVDISKQAIKYAYQNLKETNFEDKITFGARFTSKRHLGWWD